MHISKVILLILVSIGCYLPHAYAVSHPVFDQLLTDFKEPKPGACIESLQKYYQEMTSVESTEVAWAALDRQDGNCEVIPMGKGQSNLVEFDIERLESELARTDVNYFQSVHSHVSANVSYFAEEGPEYNGEIMFASQEQIDQHKVTKEDYLWLVENAGKGNIPGHNMSPPSIVDFQFLLDRKLSQKAQAQSFDAVVITSGGTWYYRAEDESKIQSARETLESLVAYAMIYEKSVSPIPSKTRDRARKLVGRQMADPESGPMIRLWQEASLKLRMPYTTEAIQLAKTGDHKLLLEEYSAKVEMAAKFAEFLTEIGVQSHFEAHRQITI